MNRFIPLTLGALVLVGGGAYYLSQSGGSVPGVSIAQAQEAAAPAEAAPEAVADMVADMVLGDADAPVTVIGYSSFTCPHCANFHNDAFKQLKADYIDTGKVRFIHREVYFDRFGLWAGMVARCGGEMRYFGMNDLIYGDQQGWIGSGDPQEVLSNLRRLGRTAGMSDGQLTACLEDEEMAQALVAAYQQNAEEHEINATPAFVINGQKHPNMSFSDMAEIIDGKLAE